MEIADVPENGTVERCYPEHGGGVFAMHLQRYEYVKDFVANKRILDFGCGEGYGTDILRKVGSFVVGSDYDKEVLYRARKKYGPDINLVVSDCLQNCFKDNLFDVVVSFEVIEHLKDIDIYLHTICKLLKDGGVFYLSTLNRSVQEKILRKVKLKKIRFHRKELNKKELEKYLKKYFEEIQLLGQMRRVKNPLYNFIKLLDWFNLRHVILPRKTGKRLIEHFHPEDAKSNTAANFIITNKIIQQAIALFAICKRPKRL